MEADRAAVNAPWRWRTSPTVRNGKPEITERWVFYVSFYTSLMAVLSNQLLEGFFVEAIFEWIMDVSQLPPESICALRDVSWSLYT